MVVLAAHKTNNLEYSSHVKSLLSRKTIGGAFKFKVVLV